MKALKLAAITVFHPLVAFDYMKKDRTHFNYLPIVVILVLMILVKMFAMYVTHYPLATVNLRKANVFIQCLVMVVPIVTWAIASYLMTTIMSGEVLFRECLMACCYSCIPYIIINFIMTICSRVLDANASGLFNTINNFALLWVLLLLFLNLYHMNHYTVLKSLGVALLGLFAMIVIFAAVSLVAALTARFFGFIGEVVSEISYKIIT